ncbi:MAG: hypothetical protein ABEL76_12405 [Bradymonadaceae bacterium]
MLVCICVSTAGCLDRYGHPPRPDSLRNSDTASDATAPDSSPPTDAHDASCPDGAGDLTPTGCPTPCRSAASCRLVVQFGTGADDEAEAVVPVPDGSGIYVAGHTGGDLFERSNAGGLDAFIAKVDGAGKLSWGRLIGGEGDERALDIAVAPQPRSLIVAGTTTGDLAGQSNRGATDVFAAGLSTDGSRQWTHLTGGPGEETLPGGTALATAGGRTFLTGTTAGDLRGAETSRAGALLARLDRRGTIADTAVAGSRGRTEGVALPRRPGRSDRLAWVGTTDEPLAGRSPKGRDWFAASYDGELDRNWLKLSRQPGPEAPVDVRRSARSTRLVLLGTRGSGENASIVVADYEPGGAPGTTTSPSIDGTLSPTGGFAGPPTDSSLVAAGRLEDRKGSRGTSAALVRIARSGSADVVRRLDAPGADAFLDAAAAEPPTIWSVGYTAGQLGRREAGGRRDVLLFRTAAPETAN